MHKSILQKHTETINITFTDGKINFSDGGYTKFKSKTATYIELSDSDGDITRLYFSEADARAILATKKEGSVPAQDNPNPITQSMLNGKTFYYSFPVANGSILYGKKTFTSDSTGTGHKITINTDGSIVKNKTFDISYTLENGQQKVEAANENLQFKLIGTDADKWNLIKKIDGNKDGNYETTTNATWYLDKPAGYPTEL